MTVFGELGEFLKDAKGSIQDVKWALDDIKGRSIAKQSAAATLQFPVIISRSINVDTASNVVKALERQYATFVQMVISLNPILDLKEDDIPSFINKLHQNNPTVLDLVESCINVYSDEAIGIRMFTSINEGCNGPVLRSNKEQMFCIEDYLNPVKLNDIFKPEQITLEKANAALDYYVLSEAKNRAKTGGRKTYKGMDGLAQAYADLQAGKNPQPNPNGPSINVSSGGGGVVNNPVANHQPSVNDSTVINGKATANTTKFDPKTYGANRNPYNKEIEDVFRQYGKHVKIDPSDNNYKGGRLYGANSAENNPKLHEELRRVDAKYGRQYSKTLYQNDTTNNSDGIEPKFGKGVDTTKHIDANEPKFGKGIGPKVTEKDVDANEPEFGVGVNTTNSEDADASAKQRSEDIQKSIEEKRAEAERIAFQRELDRADAEYRSRAIVRLHDNDIKKCNELVPTTLSVTLQQIKGDTFGGNVNFILGIKGLMHPVNSDEMISNLLDGYKSGNRFFNFLRWTSGEIAFLRDLVMNVDGIKEDALKKHRKGSSHWWTTLKRNRTLSRVKNTFGKNKILPNATIACSMEEVMEIKDAYNVDLMNPKAVMKLMDRYFLLGFVIVDESQELCYFMFDGEREFQALSFKGLERENNNKNDFKDIYKMINSGRL